jgi:hypothetical protein
VTNPPFRYVNERVQNLSKMSAPVGDRGKQPFEVVLVDTLREECDHFQERSGVGAKLSEQGGGERELDRGGEAVVVSASNTLVRRCSHSLANRFTSHLF